MRKNFSSTFGNETVAKERAAEECDIRMQEGTFLNLVGQVLRLYGVMHSKCGIADERLCAQEHTGSDSYQLGNLNLGQVCTSV